MSQAQIQYNAGYDAFMDDLEFDTAASQDWQDGYFDAQEDYN